VSSSRDLTKKDRRRAFDIFCREVRTQELFDRIMVATRRQGFEMKLKSAMHRLYPAGWLEGQRWLGGI
jgi:hypothetical protein